MTLVDYYIPAFFLEVSVLKPEELCESAHLCPKGAAARSSTRGEACGLCHHVLVEVLTMLKDPNTKVTAIFSTSALDLLCNVWLVLCTWLMRFCACRDFLQLEIVGLLFKTCSKAKNYEPQVS